MKRSKFPFATTGVALFALFVLGAAFWSGCGRQDGKKEGNAGDAIRRDIGPIEKRLPSLMPIKAVYWKGEVLTKDSRLPAPGPTDTRITGFVVLDEKQADKYITGYKWKNMPESWQPGMPVPNKKWTGAVWSQSAEFTYMIKPPYVTGKFYLDQADQVLYFEWENG